MSDDPGDCDFDWVGAHHSCTAHFAFPRLRGLAGRSVETRAAQIRDDRQATPSPRFAATNDGYAHLPRHLRQWPRS